MTDASSQDVHEAAHEALSRLRSAEITTYHRRRQWEERLERIWGAEPPYVPQAEDGSSWFFGRFFYSWIGDTMRRASEEELTADELPGPKRVFRAYGVGRELSREMSEQRARRRRWDCFVGSCVSLKVQRGWFTRARWPSSGDGTLRYVGPVKQLTQDSGELFAGIAWRTAPLQRRAARDGAPAATPGWLLTDGEVEGERLFSLQEGEAVASVERLGDVVFTLGDVAVHRDMNREAKGYLALLEKEVPRSVKDGACPTSMGIGKGIVRSLARYLLPAVPYCIIKNVLTLLSPVVLQVYISYIEAIGSSPQLQRPANSSSSFSPLSPLGPGLASSSFASSVFSGDDTSSSSSDGGGGGGLPSPFPFGLSSLPYGVLLTALLFLIPISESVASSRFSFLCYRCSFTTKHALIALLMEKCLTVSNKALADPAMSAGRLVNMMSSDVGRISSFAQLFWSMLSAPFVLSASVYLLHRLVGWSAFVGAAVLVLFMPLQGVVMVFMFKTFQAKAKATDARIKATNEFISGIRVAKFMSWEPSFVISIEEKRNEELRQLRSIQYMYMVVHFLMNAAPSVVVASVFFTYSAAGHSLTPSVVFPVITLLWILQMPFFMIPMSIQMVLRCIVSARRVNRFLSGDDTDPILAEDAAWRTTPGEEREKATGRAAAAQVDQQRTDDCWDRTTAVLFRHANLTAYVPVPLVHPKQRERRPEGAAAEAAAASSSPSPSPQPASKSDEGDSFYDLRPKVLLAEVNLRIPRGKLTVVVGPTGSGKSTLLDSLIGAVDVSSGQVLSSLSVAYVPQQPWIMNATLRENVLFFTDEDATRFERALDCSQLRADLSLLADGPETEIGERGINLSGGQKARVGLARAVYADKELYLMDDPLSALDVHVGERVMRECVLGELAAKTRVLATHQVHVVDLADLVVLVEDGRVTFTGTPEEFHQKGLTVTERAKGEDHSRDEQPATCAREEAEVTAEDERGTRSGEEEKRAAAPPPPADDPNDLKQQTKPHQPATSAGSTPTSPPADTPSGEARRDAEATAAAAERGVGPTEQGRLLSEEEMARGAVSKEVYVRYLRACGGWGTWAALVALYGVTEVLSTGPYLWLSLWSTDVFHLTTNRYLLVYALLTLGDVLCSPLRYLSVSAAGRRAGRALHSGLLRSVALGTLRFFDTTPTGRLINRFSKDMEQLDDDLPGDISSFLSSAASALSVVVILLSSQYLLLLLLLPLLVLYVRLMRFYNAANRHLQRMTNVSHSAIFSILGETLSGRWTIEAYRKGGAVMAKALRSLDRIYASAFMMHVGNKWLSVRIESITAVITASVAGLGVLACHLPWLMGSRVGMLALSLLTARRLNWVLNSMVMQLASVEADMNAVERVSAYTHAIDQEEGALAGLEAEIAAQLARQGEGRGAAAAAAVATAGWDGDSEGAALLTGPVESSAESAVAVAVAPSPTPRVDGAGAFEVSSSASASSLEFRHVDVRYRPGLPLVLRDVSFKIAPKEKVGVVGRTGSGKSTLLLTFLRLVEVCGGEMSVCGRPATSYGVRSLRQLFSMIPQDPLLFGGTVRSNLDPFGEASDVACWAALGHVGMADRVRSEADGLDGRVAEGGSNFSVGQRQLLCLARALLKRGSAFLLMDEATANVDPAMDRQIQETVAREFGAYTVITIAHRLHTVAGYDTILMMDGGHVVASGSPRALLSDDSSPFAELVRSMGEEAQRRFVDAMKPS